MVVTAAVLVLVTRITSRAAKRKGEDERII